jgi:thiosulfate/3-mercaptopyruvate sulfurtransferase
MTAPQAGIRTDAAAGRRAWFSSPTVTADWLASHLASVVVADVRWSLGAGARRADYQAGHIPGAVFVDLDDHLAGPPSAEEGRHPLPDPQQFADCLGRLGIGDLTPVVAYDDAEGSSAARLWWLLHALGLPAAVLDGGLASWGGPLASGESDVEPVTRTVRPWPADRFVDADHVEHRSGAARTVLIDARSAARYADGDLAIDTRPGHIPGARSAPWTENLDRSTGRFLPRVDLHRRFEALGAAKAELIVAYCGSGITACHDLLALELAGLHHTALFPGSWSAWAADPDRPATTGSNA